MYLFALFKSDFHSLYSKPVNLQECVGSQPVNPYLFALFKSDLHSQRGLSFVELAILHVLEQLKNKVRNFNLCLYGMPSLHKISNFNSCNYTKLVTSIHYLFTKLVTFIQVFTKS